jgi:hypothetical protein
MEKFEMFSSDAPDLDSRLVWLLRVSAGIANFLGLNVTVPMQGWVKVSF